MDEKEMIEQKAEEPVAVEETKTVATPSGKAALKSRYMEKYPDTDWEAASDDDYANRAMEDYDEYEGKIKQHEDNDKKLSDLFDKNPQSASFLIGMANGEDFLVNLQRNYGADIVEAMQNPDKLDELKKANQEYVDKVAKSKELEQQWETNMEGTLDRLQAEQDKNGMTDEQVATAMDALEKVVGEYLEGNISTETLQMFLKGQHHDADVEAAKREGEVNGRNANINEKLRKAKAQSDGIPSLGGQSNNNAKGAVLKRGGNRFGNVGSGIWASGNFRRNNYE